MTNISDTVWRHKTLIIKRSQALTHHGYENSADVNTGLRLYGPLFAPIKSFSFPVG